MMNSLFKIELIDLKISKEGNTYYGKGRAKLGIAEVAIRCSSGYRSFNITASDDTGKTVNLEDLKKIGFSADSASIEARYEQLVGEFKKEEERLRQFDRGKKYDAHPIHWLARDLKKISFETSINTNRDAYVKEWSDRIFLTAVKNGIKIVVEYDQKYSVRIDNDWQNVKKTTKWNRAITLVDEAYLRAFNKNRETTILNDQFETERLRLSKELGITVNKAEISHSYHDGRRMKYSYRTCYLIEVPQKGTENIKIKFGSTPEMGISIISISGRISQEALVTLINKSSGQTLANEIPVKEPVPNITGSRKLNPIG